MLVPVILGKWSLSAINLLQFLEIFIFRSPLGVQVQLGFGAFFRCDTWIQESFPWGLAAQALVPLQHGWEESLWRYLFQQVKSPGCSLWCCWSLSPGNMLLRDCSAKVWLFSTETSRSISLLTSYGSEEAWPKCIGHPVIISKGESLWVPKMGDLRLRRTNGIAFG